MTDNFEERLLVELRSVVAGNLIPTRVPARRMTRRRAALAFTPVGAAAAALAVALSLSGGHPSLAQAAIIKKAAAALDQPGSIIYVQGDVYADGEVIAFPSANAPYTTMITTAPPVQGGISADPANDTLSLSFQEWGNGSEDRTVYNNGDQTALGVDESSYYDASSNSLLTLTDLPQGGPRATPVPIPTAQNLEDPSYYEDLYQQAESGQPNLQLVGQATIGGEQTYELSYQITPPAGGTCGSSTCSPPSQELLLYLDAQTFVPVRTVMMVGSVVSSVTDYTVQTLPDTAANEADLQISPAAGATQLTETYAQWHAALGAAPQSDS